MPPRMGKSIVSSIAFPAWCLGRDPTKKIMCISYDRAVRRNVLGANPGHHGAALVSEVFSRHAPHDETAARTANVAWRSRFASGRSGDVLGRGADLIILDDPMKPLETTMPGRSSR